MGFDSSRVASLWRRRPQEAGGIDFSGNNHQNPGLNFGLTSSGSYQATWKPIEMATPAISNFNSNPGGLFSPPSPVQQNSPLRKSVYDLYMQRLGKNNVAPRQSLQGAGGVNVMADYRRRL